MKDKLIAAAIFVLVIAYAMVLCVAMAIHLHPELATEQRK